MKTADLIDNHAEKLRLCHLPFLRFGRRAAFHGKVQTVKCFEDNVLLKSELQKPGEDRVLVVDAGGSTRIAVLGDMIATIMSTNHWAGIIINGAIRDCAEIDQMDVGVRCLATSPVKSSKDGAGTTGIPIHFGGVEIAPGDFVYCDEDGVLFSQYSLVD